MRDKTIQLKLEKDVQFEKEINKEYREDLGRVLEIIRRYKNRIMTLEIYLKIIAADEAEYDPVTIARLALGERQEEVQ